ncbi:MAG: hypothetical protein OEL66_02440 [Desulfobulbaceae bacterium]|nr:hypothetical protein [Desulfobulbaceae bacterium]
MRRPRLYTLPIILLLTTLLHVLCPTPQAVASDLVIGSGPDSRQMILSELAALLLEQEGITVTIRPGLIETELLSLLRNNEVNLCFLPLQTNRPAETQPPGIVPLPPFPFDAGPVLLMRGKQATELQIQTISQLVEQSKYNPLLFRFGDMDSVSARQLAGYGLPLSSANPLPSALLYNVLKNSQVDVALGQADDGRIIAFRLLPLEDDRNLLPDLRPTPLTSEAALRQYPAITATIAKLTARLDIETMRRLHGSVVIAHRQPRAVAQEWLHGQDLLR